MNKLNPQQIFSKTTELLHQLYPNLPVQKISLEDENVVFSFTYYLNVSIAIEINAELRDNILSFFIILLNENGERFPGYDYYFPR